LLRLKISESANLGLHAMAFLGSDSDNRHSIREIASVLGVSQATLSKVMQRLVKCRLVDSIRGPRGGFKLGKPGDKISLLDVYEALDGPAESVNCLLKEKICASDTCIMGGLIEKINGEFVTYMAKTRLSDLTDIFRKE
jgi:Rrf2 family protein